MKGIILFLMLCLTHLSFAAEKSSGCGLGWRVTKSMTTTGSSIRGLTNHTFSNTFGMTSGTSGCQKHDLVLLQKKKIHFIEANRGPLDYEVALGQGERLEALVNLFGCQGESAQLFKKDLRANRAKFFSPSASSAEVLSGIESHFQTHSILGTSCII